MNRRELAAKVLLAKILGDHIGSLIKDSKADLVLEMAPGDRVAVGPDALGGAAQLGAVTMTRGRQVAKVLDRKAFLAWVLKHHESETYVEVRPAFERYILDVALAEGIAVDRETGEVIPGVQIVDSDPYLMVKPTNEAREVLIARLEQRLELL